ncbi:MAG: hypothetical protein GY696_09445 [Gammaproteobacteria bacterium]|nr:hypothetical protein [Gammaproteobacteria bacterium]
MLECGHGGRACPVHGVLYNGVVEPADRVFNAEGSAAPKWVRPALFEQIPLYPQVMLQDLVGSLLVTNEPFSLSR